jgi:hypothetical protein
MRRTAPYVIGKDLRFLSEGFFILCITGVSSEQRSWTQTRKIAGPGLPGVQISALTELGTDRISAHSPRRKGGCLLLCKLPLANLMQNL